MQTIFFLLLLFGKSFFFLLLPSFFQHLGVCHVTMIAARWAVMFIPDLVLTLPTLCFERAQMMLRAVGIKMATKQACVDHFSWLFWTLPHTFLLFTSRTVRILQTVLPTQLLMAVELALVHPVLVKFT